MRNVLLSMILCFQSLIWAQTGYIKGKLSDTLDYSNVKGKIFLTADKPLFFDVDSTGRFFIDSLQPGTWDIVFEKPGYEPLTQTGIVVVAYKYTILDDLHFVPVGTSKKKSKRRR